MKKILSMVLAVLLLTCSAFALDFSADLNFTLPSEAYFTSSETNITLAGLKYQEKTINNYFDNSIGFDIAGQVMVTNKFGVRAELGFDFPRALTNRRVVDVKNNYTTFYAPVTSNYSSVYNSYFDASIFIGPVIKLNKVKFFDLYVTPGFLMQINNGSKKNSDDSVVTYTWFDCGVGAEIEARYNITKNVYARLGCPFVWMFNEHDAMNKGASTDTQKLYFAPKLGLGYKF